MVIANNPAGRLLEAFDRGQNIQQGVNALDGWRAAFHATDSPEGTADVYRHFTDMMLWAADTRRRVQQLDPRLLDDFDGVETTLRNVYSVSSINLEQFFSSYTPAAQYGLKSCNYALTRDDPDPTALDQTQLEDVMTTLREVLDAIDDLKDIDPVVSERIAKHVRDALRYAEDPNLWGTQAVADAVNISIGQVFVNYGAVSKSSKKDIILNGLGKVGWMLVGAGVQTGMDQLAAAATSAHAQIAAPGN